MLGCIIGDIVGSSREFSNTDDPYFEFFVDESTFTDDTVLTIATADVLLNGGGYSEAYTKYCLDYPNRGWGCSFKTIIKTKGKLEPYNSYGNGSAMRVSPIGWYSKNIDQVMEEAKKSAEVSHDHIEGIRGAQSVALAIFLARKGIEKEKIIELVEYNCGYDLSNSSSNLPYGFDVTCQGTIPLCFALFNETVNFEDAIRMTVLRGGDVDTNACIVGAIAEAYYGHPPYHMEVEAWKRLDEPLRIIAERFMRKYIYQERKLND